MPIGKLVLIYKEFTLHFNVYKNQAGPHCLVKQNKLTNRHWGLGVPPSDNKSLGGNKLLTFDISKVVAVFMVKLHDDQITQSANDSITNYSSLLSSKIASKDSEKRTIVIHLKKMPNIYLVLSKNWTYLSLIFSFWRFGSFTRFLSFDIGIFGASLKI